MPNRHDFLLLQLLSIRQRYRPVGISTLARDRQIRFKFREKNKILTDRCTSICHDRALPHFGKPFSSAAAIETADLAVWTWNWGRRKREVVDRRRLRSSFHRVGRLPFRRLVRDLLRRRESETAATKIWEKRSGESAPGHPTSTTGRGGESLFVDSRSTAYTDISGTNN